MKKPWVGCSWKRAALPGRGPKSSNPENCDGRDSYLQQCLRINLIVMPMGVGIHAQRPKEIHF